MHARVNGGDLATAVAVAAPAGMNRRIAAYGVSVTLLALLCIAALIRLESSLGAEPFRYFQLGDAAHGSIGTQVVLQRQERQQANKLRGSNKAKLSASQSRQYVDDELMAPWLIARIEKQEKSDWLAPMHVHLLWIGDLKKAPKDRLKYPEMGYTLKVHTSAEEILDGFHPYVLQAYHKAVPAVVGYDFLKLAMLYKYGGLSLDADTSPTLPASELEFPEDCDIVLGKERHLHYFEKPKYRESGPNTYGYSRPFQVLNWAMAASKPRNPHIKWMLKTAMMHFFGLRDMERAFIQDIAGSGLITDYVALLHEKEGRRFADVYEAKEYIPVEGVCVSDHYFKGKWIHHSSPGSWKKNGGAGGAQ